MRWTRGGLTRAGFEGFIPFVELPTADVPKRPGVYVVVRESTEPPVFLAANPAGRFKQKDPTVAPPKLVQAWVDGAIVLYMGKAGGDEGGLRRRLDTLRRFGMGEPVGHWGGRYLWQLDGAEGLTVAWREAEEDDPREVKRELLEEFATDHGQLPFANLRAAGQRVQ